MENRKRKAGDEPRKPVNKKRKPAQSLPPPEPSFRLTALPPELQTLIWEFAIYTIPARRVGFNVGRSDEVIWRSPVCSYARPPIPAPLHVCRLSRGLALRRWQLLSPGPDYDTWTYFDMETDTVHFEFWTHWTGIRGVQTSGGTLMWRVFWRRNEATA